MKDSSVMQRLQKTLVQGLLFDVNVERGDRIEGQSIPSASNKGRDGATETSLSENLLEEILSSENLAIACKRVKSNKGCSGIDEMEVKGLPEYLKYKGEGLSRFLRRNMFRLR